ncbi:MAG: GNAT family N-acetyltransferase [Desulfocapsaceae bacterium]|nr:GNAT family N-acetyltransferase [Desulfocapsaceae bacterium]
MEPKSIIISYLELKYGQNVQGTSTDIKGLRIEQLSIPCPAFNYFMYRAIGGEWFWVDKLNWSEKDWQTYVQQDNLQTWGAWLHGAPCGYFELEQREAETIEIAYFGILKQFLGCGLGKKLLLEALAIAGREGEQRVTVNTCSLDHPAALANYLNRGMTIYHEETIEKILPNISPTFWPG